MNAIGNAMNFCLRKQELLERAEHVEKKARCQNNVQAKDIMRALALLYREMAEELDEGSVIPGYCIDLRRGRHHPKN